MSIGRAEAPDAAPDADGAASPLRIAKDGVRVRVRVTPGARRAGIEGTVDLPDGPAVKLRVTAPAEGGRANAAAIALLAKAWHIPKSRLEIVAGAGQRLKTIRVAGDPVELRARAESWLKRRSAT